MTIHLLVQVRNEIGQEFCWPRDHAEATFEEAALAAAHQSVSLAMSREGWRIQRICEVTYGNEARFNPVPPHKANPWWEIA